MGTVWWTLVSHIISIFIFIFIFLFPKKKNKIHFTCFIEFDHNVFFRCYCCCWLFLVAMINNNNELNSWMQKMFLMRITGHWLFYFYFWLFLQHFLQCTLQSKMFSIDSRWPKSKNLIESLDFYYFKLLWVALDHHHLLSSLSTGWRVRVIHFFICIDWLRWTHTL